MSSKVATKKDLKKLKVSMKEKIAKAKEEYAIKKIHIKHSRRVGYSSGAHDYEKLPKVKGATKSAKKGYGTALKDGARREKINSKFEKGKNYGKK